MAQSRTVRPDRRRRRPDRRARSAALRPLGCGDVTPRPAASGRSGSGPNRERTIPHGFEQLDGRRQPPELPAGRGAVRARRYRALGIMFDGPFPFLDSDVYKWLEGAGWELGRAPDEADRGRWPTRRSTLVAAAQRPDGYLNTFVQVLAPGQRVPRPAVGPRALLRRPSDPGRRRLAPRARRRSSPRSSRARGRASRRAGRSGPAAARRIDGHPEIEMALVELYRVTGERR